MTRYRRRYWLLAAGLAALAGYVDAIGFLKLGGLFMSFMSGNSTRLAVGVAEGSTAALAAASLIAAFVAGVVAGSLIAAVAGAARKAAVLALATSFLACAALLDGVVGDRWTTAVMAAAMGATNCVFQRGGEVSIGVTYMTGTLPRLGSRVRIPSPAPIFPNIIMQLHLSFGAVFCFPGSVPDNGEAWGKQRTAHSSDVSAAFGCGAAFGGCFLLRVRTH